MKVCIRLSIGVILGFFPTALFGGDSNSGLLLGVRSSNAASVQAELAKGAHVNVPDKDGNTALMFSVMYGFAKMDIVNALLTHGANVNAQSNDGATALIRNDAPHKTWVLWADIFSHWSNTLYKRYCIH